MLVNEPIMLGYCVCVHWIVGDKLAQRDDITRFYEFLCDNLSSVQFKCIGPSSLWPCCLKRGSAAAGVLGLGFRIHWDYRCMSFTNPVYC